MFLLGQGFNTQKIRQLMETNIAGELTLPTYKS